MNQDLLVGIAAIGTGLLLIAGLWLLTEYRWLVTECRYPRHRRRGRRATTTAMAAPPQHPENLVATPEELAAFNGIAENLGPRFAGRLDRIAARTERTSR